MRKQEGGSPPLPVLLLLSIFVGLSTAELFISHQAEVKEEGENLVVLCKDKETGAKVSWKSWKQKPLGTQTIPRVIASMYGTQLIFNPVRKKDEGTYVCQSPTESSTFNLIVSAPIAFMDTPSTVTTRENRAVLLPCEAKNADIQWHYNNTAITENDDKFEIIADGLLIKNVTRKDAGQLYMCRAVQPKSGQFLDKWIDLIVKHPPREKYAKENIVFGYLGGFLNLTCAVEAHPPPKYRWYQRNQLNKLYGKEMKGSNSSVLMLVLASEKDFTEYKCHAWNEEGSLELYYTVVKGTKPPPPAALELVEARADALLFTVRTFRSENDTEDATTPSPPPPEFDMEPKEIRLEYRPFDRPSDNWDDRLFPVTAEETYLLNNLTDNTTYLVRAATVNVAGISDYINVTETTAPSRAHAITPDLTGRFAIVLILVGNLFYANI